MLSFPSAHVIFCTVKSKPAFLAICLQLIVIISMAQNDSLYLIKAGKIFNSETGAFAQNVAVLVKGTFIVKVKSISQLTEKELSENSIIDLSDYCILPGLMDAHTHLLFKETLMPGNRQGTSINLANSLIFSGDAYRAIYGAARAKGYLEGGITSVQDLGNSGQFADIALQKAIWDGLVNGPRMKCSGPGLSAAGGQIPGVLHKYQGIVEDEYRIVKGIDDAIHAVRENIAQGATVIKIFSDNSPNNTMLSVGEMSAIVEEAHSHHYRVTAHAVGNRSVYNAVMAGVDGIDHGYEIADSTLILMKKKGTVLVPTDGDSLTLEKFAALSDPGNTETRKSFMDYKDALHDRLRRANKIGVTIVFGSDDYIDFHLPFAESSKRGLIGYYEAGMTIPAILQAATINAAKHFGWSNRLGIIKEGMVADIIAVNKNISENIESILKVNFVMRNGKVYVK
ncbi:MAG: amidohydrolase family protein [Chitinophagaceae bacterium]|nr:MAG: amidohydrolase family protein [Chitinophagaceae bacterium]